jgi:hypothetical protein
MRGVRIGPVKASLGAVLALLLLLPFISIRADAAENRSYAEKTVLTLKLKETTVQKVLMEIERISEFYFSYSNRQIEADRKVTINLKNKTAMEALDELFEGSGVKYTIDGRHIILFKTDDVGGASAFPQQDRRITGTVRDVQGEAIAGASVIEKGTTNGTATDSDGHFTLLLTGENATLQVNYIGYKPLEINVMGGGG